MTDKRPLVVGLGEVLWDVLPDKKVPGGAPANFAFHAGQLGADAVVVSAVGADRNGIDLLEWFRTVGFSTEYVQTNVLPTGHVTVQFDGQGQPKYEIHESVAWDAIAWNDQMAALASRCNSVCVGTLAQRSVVTRETVRRFLTATPPDCLRIFDLNLRQQYYSPEVVDQTLGLCNILKLNDQEWPYLVRMFGLNPDWSVGLQQLREMKSVSLIALTRGEHGSTLLNKDGISEMPCLPIDVVDSVGAGDAFTAAVATGLLFGQSTRQLHQTASAIAALVCAQSGAMPRFTREQITRTAGSSESQKTA